MAEITKEQTEIQSYEMEVVAMPGRIVNHVPRLMAERFPDLDQKGKAKELSFGARLARGTAVNLVDPEYDPKAIYFEVLINLCDFFGVPIDKVFEYVPDA